MELERFSDTWIFKRHSKEELSRWITHLEYSYFMRAWGGQAHDGDQFKLTLSYKDKDELFDLLNNLDIRLKPATDGLTTVFNTTINDFPEYQQPAHIELNGIKCFCYIHNGYLSFDLAGGLDGDRYEVTETDFENCKKLERLILEKNLVANVSRDVERDVSCISMTKYRDLLKD